MLSCTLVMALFGSGLVGSSAAALSTLAGAAAAQHRFLQSANISITGLQPFDDGLQVCAAQEDMFELNCDANPSMLEADLGYNFASSDACSQHSPFMKIIKADNSNQLLASASRVGGDRLEASNTYPANSTDDGTIVGRARVEVGWTESSGEQSQQSGPLYVFDAQCILRGGQVETQIINENPHVILGSREGEGTIPISMKQFVNRRDPETGQETNFYGKPADQRDRPGFEVSFVHPATDPALDINVRNVHAEFGDGRSKPFLIDGERRSADLLGLQYADTTRSAHFVLEPQLEVHSDNRPTWLFVDVLVTKDRPKARLGIGPGQSPTAAEWRENVGLTPGPLDNDNGGRRRAQVDNTSYLAASQVGPGGLEFTVSGSYTLSAPPVEPPVVPTQVSRACAMALSAVVSVATLSLSV